MNFSHISLSRISQRTHLYRVIGLILLIIALVVAVWIVFGKSEHAVAPTPTHQQKKPTYIAPNVTPPQGGKRGILITPQ